MKKKRNSPKGEILSAMQIPADLAYREAVLTFFGRRELYVENYRRILEYHDTRLRILTHSGILQIEGNCLVIAYYSNEEMKITGQIRLVLFDP